MAELNTDKIIRDIEERMGIQEKASGLVIYEDGKGYTQRTWSNHLEYGIYYGLEIALSILKREIKEA